ncbi:uncharacterized protein MEPE_04369 [Melanopsichium pennsylvanicum]|uniref:Uncharacterized protein n=1 Tax=Melanopsichium pennsylvanicum TaxID=63383 RepID=A0AAJ4XNQ3_9BASI|nr:uncharacterized protein MEPE_04369 [Melanopsichium pennsylvanicum]
MEAEANYQSVEYSSYSRVLSICAPPTHTWSSHARHSNPSQSAKEKDLSVPLKLALSSTSKPSFAGQLETNLSVCTLSNYEWLAVSISVISIVRKALCQDSGACKRRNTPQSENSLPFSPRQILPVKRQSSSTSCFPSELVMSTWAIALIDAHCCQSTTAVRVGLYPDHSEPSSKIHSKDESPRTEITSL